VREAIIRCLQKDLKKRCASIDDARYEIEQALADPSGVLVQPQILPEPQLKWRPMLPWIVAALVLGAIFAGVAVWKLKPTEPHQVIRFHQDLPSDQQFSFNSRMFGIACCVLINGKILALTCRAGEFRDISSSTHAFLPLPGKIKLLSHSSRHIAYYQHSSEGTE
jgi:hypothetical protein